MRRLPLLLPLLLVLVACSGDAAPRGPVQLAIDPRTNHQVAPAAEDDSLPKSVDAVLFRGRDGRVSFRLVTPLYAQTEVDGAPVAGEIVNAVPIGDCPLTPWNPTAKTGSDGKARFFFEPGTRAGTCMAEIRYTDGQTRLVTDTAVAEVKPGDPDWHTSNPPFASGTTPTTSWSGSWITDRYHNPGAIAGHVGQFLVGPGLTKTSDTTFVSSACDPSQLNYFTRYSSVMIYLDGHAWMWVPVRIDNCYIEARDKVRPEQATDTFPDLYPAP